MWNACRDYFVERLLPTLSSLVWKARDQIHIDVRNSRRAQALNVAQCRFARVQTCDRARFFIYERLHAEADAIDSATKLRVDHLGVQSSRRTFDCDFRV